jgi:hypothetical protein
MSCSPAGPRQAGFRSPAGATLNLMSRAGALGADYRLARIAAGACDALYMYAAMRWLVFRDVHAQDRPRRRISRPR